MESELLPSYYLLHSYRIYTDSGERTVTARDEDEAAKLFAEAEDLPDGIVDAETLIESVLDVGGWVGMERDGVHCWEYR